MRVAAEIILTDSEKKILKKNVNSRAVSIRLCERSKIVLLAADGLDNKAIALRLNIPAVKVGRWRNRFSEGGIGSIIQDRPRGANHGGKNTLEQAKLRKKIIEKTTREKPDNATHKHQKIKNWMTRNKRVFLHFTPTSSSWLNLVERFFGVLTEKRLKRGIFTSVRELEQKIIEYIDNHNETPKPFVWTKSAKEILEKVGRARAVLDNIHTN